MSHRKMLALLLGLCTDGGRPSVLGEASYDNRASCEQPDSEQPVGVDDRLPLYHQATEGVAGDRVCECCSCIIGKRDWEDK